MKRILIILLPLILCTFVLSAQDQQEIVSKCALDIGENTTYLKDFVIKLPKVSDSSKETPVHKANMYLMKKQNYRFTMCNADGSEGELYVSLYDKDKLITSSFISSSGTVYSSLEFECNKTGLYQLWYSFKDGQEGRGVGIVSLVK